LRADGTVKVLDFGLAKLLDTDAPGRSSGAGGFDASASPTITTPAMTISGVILGTAAYMSPEQAKGRPADKRSDIWAFGCVLYEILTGKRAFDGEDVSDTLAAILRGEPEWKSLRPTTPPAITQLLRRCLERDPRRRLHDIADARIELEDIRATSAASHDAEHGIADRLKLRWAIPLVLTSLVIGAAGGAPKAVTTLDSAKGETAHHWPGMFPDGKRCSMAPVLQAPVGTTLRSWRSRFKRANAARCTEAAPFLDTCPQGTWSTPMPAICSPRHLT
jgi:hypothetical protein